MTLEQSLSLASFRNYYTLTKPGIIMGNAITAAGGFFLAAKGHIDFKLLILTLLGLSFIVASGCVFNNYIDRFADEKMMRTKSRPLAKKLIPINHALAFAVALGVVGAFLLMLFVNLLAAGVALIGFFIYVAFYSFFKYQTHHATLIGSIAGAVPPVVGYSAVSHQIDLGALLFFILMVLWQMPHFYAIALYRLEDYRSASIPVLPIKRGVRATKIQMLLYVFGFILASCALTVFGYTGSLYLTGAALLGTLWLGLSIQGFNCRNDTKWARQMFLFSLITITALCAFIPLSVAN